MNREERVAYRHYIVEEIERQLFGPAGGRDELITETPFWRYLTGLLFPSNLVAESLEVSDEPDVNGAPEDSSTEDPSLSSAYDSLPASMGVSFFLAQATRLVVSVEAAWYKDKRRDGEKYELWQRIELAGPSDPLEVEFQIPSEGGVISEQIFEGRAEVRLVCRPRIGGQLVTVTLINSQLADGGKTLRDVEKILAQCRFKIRASDGFIGEYPGVARRSLHPEDAELELTYRSRKTYGIGHGCAAAWDSSADTVREIVAEPLPRLEVKGLTNETSVSERASRALSMRWLADPSTPIGEVVEALEAFCDDYEAWVEDQQQRASRLDSADSEVAVAIVGRQREALARMRKSVQVLKDDGPEGLIVKAFRFAQRAMLTQFVWSRRLDGRTFSKGEGLVNPIDPGDAVYEQPKWRPFQLAFQLVVLDSLQDPLSEDRDRLDLLWFPTGGGKTEAYLALAAFEIALRRLRYGDSGGGTTVLMRYTLRLLTAQQFERSSRLVSVMEHLRRCEPELGLGEMPITLGLWVGGDTTPNRIDSDSSESPGAKQLIEDRVLVDEYPENPFQLFACPYCGTRIVPEKKTAKDCFGLRIQDGSLLIHCPDERCPLHPGIPVYVVDEDIYRRAPSIVIGTIDKFARMVWEPRSRTLLGCGVVSWGDGSESSTSVLPPSLIIQDELHLITGPLGTIAGVYEAAIDTAMRLNGIKPKYVAATATIQRANEQCERLYAREAFLFPPPGVDASDSFFSRVDESSPGRMYVGAMNNGVFGPLSMLVQASAAAAHAASRLAEDSDSSVDSRVAVDTYWTQVIYHNSRHELGKTTTILRDDVESRLASLEPDEARRRSFEHVEELSGNLKSGSDVSLALERLKVSWPSEEAIDVLACTNMISVGVDVGRLGLMIVKGQPKTTSEYIQATSRVGRDSRRPPAIVLTLYASNRPRDRSHYETFHQFHQALYRWVEPTSVTPFAPPALDRTLHAAIVLTVRHFLRLDSNESAATFELDDADTRQVLQALLERLMEACPPEDRDVTEERFWELAQRWNDEARASGGNLRFSKVSQFPGLLGSFGSSTRPLTELPWPTLNSMRHVDGEAPVANVAERR